MVDETRTGYLMMRKSGNYLQGAALEDNSSESVCKDKLLGLSEGVTSNSKKKKTVRGENTMFANKHHHCEQAQPTSHKLGDRLIVERPPADDERTDENEIELVVERMLPKVRHHKSNPRGDRKRIDDRVTKQETRHQINNKSANERPKLVTPRGGGTNFVGLVLQKMTKRNGSKNATMKLKPNPAAATSPSWSSSKQLKLAIKTKSSSSFLEPMMPFNKKMPISLQLAFVVISLLLISHRRQQQPTYLAEAVLQRPAAPAATLSKLQNLDLLKIVPPFAPTRYSGVSVNSTIGRTPRDNENRRVQQEQKFEPIRMASSSKFTRTNELDTYLDDMNHNELRTVANGQPIRDLFNAKPMSDQVTSPISQQQRSPTNKDAAQASAGLMGSHSEQQIYSECALILQRTYVKNLDDPKHRLVPFGKTEQACISYKHIDKAVEQAKHKLKFREFAKMRKVPISSGPRKPPLAPLDVIHSTLEPPEDLIAAIGEINMATTQIIADQFDLSNDELLNGLPLIDMSKTKFWPLCPLLVRQDIKCRVSRFRTFTGHCNNIKHPSWGAAMTPYARYLPPVHPDGIWIPRKSIVSEMTFDLTDNHHEIHSNIPQPVFDGTHNEDETRHQADYRHHHQPIISHHSVVDHRTGGDRDSSIHDNELAVDSSVHFVRRTKLDQPAENNFATTMATTVAAATHYHQSHSPERPYAATAFPPTIAAESTSAVATHHHHLHQMHHQNQPMIATAASSPHKQHQHHSALQELPSARLVSSVVHRDVDQPNHDFSLTFMSWGQVINHDMTRAAQPPSSIKCCNNGQQLNGTTGLTKHKLCLPIQVPRDDPFYSKFNVQCLEFRRSLAGVRPNCVLGPRVHQNAITHPVDASFVYGSSQAQADALRLFKGGRLRDRDWFHREGLKPLLPAQEIEPDLECIARPKDLFCFLAGDVRANEQTHLTVLHTLYMREHNRLADKLSELNPHWDDERTFQEARHIVAAGIQHVLINEYVPLLIGRKMAELYNLTAQPAHQGTPVAARQAYWRGYDPTITTSVSNSFAAAAFRQGHSFVQGTIERFNKFHEFVASEKLRFLFKQPFLLYQPGVIDELTIGMLDQPSQSHDPFMSEDVSGHLFQPPELQFGHDLAAINIQRGRDQGLPGYNLWREWCGLPRAETFEQLEPYLTNHTAYHYSRLYKHVDDIDLWSGGVSERRLPGAAIGPTFACIIARQFSNTRRGDRYWYENPGLPSSFTPDQLGELRKITLAKLLCANSDDLPTIQRWALRMAHPVLNPRVDCHQLPEMDLQFWQEE